jgi:hypothetical protein
MNEEHDHTHGAPPDRDVSAAYREYEAGLVERLWEYREARFAGQGDPFDHHVRPTPPVFRQGKVLHNVLTRPAADAERDRLLGRLPRTAGHRWLGSMKSSQALVWSVFANLAAADRLSRLADLPDDLGRPLFPGVDRGANLHLEHDVADLGEPRPTSLDALLDVGGYRIAIEGKLTETDIGRCSRPALRPGKDAGYERDHCDGSYTIQRGRRQRCSLSEIGVSYWRHVPTLFRWSADADLRPCPLRRTYQLVRNVLAATVPVGGRSDGRADATRGHAVLLYDGRNPHFGPGGAAWLAVRDVRDCLRCPGLLRLGTWQQVAGAIAGDGEVGWLAEELQLKYGIAGSSKR